MPKMAGSLIGGGGRLWSLREGRAAGDPPPHPFPRWFRSRFRFRFRGESQCRGRPVRGPGGLLKVPGGGLAGSEPPWPGPPRAPPGPVAFLSPLSPFPVSPLSPSPFPVSRVWRCCCWCWCCPRGPRGCPDRTSQRRRPQQYPGPPPQVTRGDRPAAHVVASPWPSSRGSLRWQAGVAPALVRNGVRLRGRTRLVVPRDGLYFVYASAAFSGGRCGARGAPPRRPLRLAVVAALSREYPRDVPLLRAARSVCPPGGLGGLWAETLYQGAVFQLRRGDRLAATTSAGRFLDLHGAGHAYFGVLGVD
ncbi:LOW QUALITY PROTEIN: uncharacterized protein LOC141725795 [Zonotrichia albicollis]|uniref:LOW QUALITY PROTEIN: uncharacterized protein LOC141725795 n=1 Tax=Zonotrichia albicollis TaxID=44394 RepID=UPI003D81143C